jgi:hypothetical protein
VSKTVLDAIDAELASLTPVTPRTGALGFGTDLACVTDLSASLDEVDPLSPVGIGEAALRRLMTPRGGLLDDPDYGIDVRSFCSRGVAVDELRDLAGTIKLELVKDDRIETVLVGVTMPAPSTLRISILITAALPALTPFSLIFVATPETLTVEVIG